MSHAQAESHVLQTIRTHGRHGTTSCPPPLRQLCPYAEDLAQIEELVARQQTAQARRGLTSVRVGQVWATQAPQDSAMGVRQTRTVMYVGMTSAILKTDTQAPTFHKAMTGFRDDGNYAVLGHRLVEDT